MFVNVLTDVAKHAPEGSRGTAQNQTSKTITRGATLVLLSGGSLAQLLVTVVAFVVQAG